MLDVRAGDAANVDCMLDPAFRIERPVSWGRRSPDIMCPSKGVLPAIELDEYRDHRNMEA